MQSISAAYEEEIRELRSKLERQEQAIYELRSRLDKVVATLKEIDEYDWSLGDNDPKTMARQERLELKADAFSDVVSIARRALERVK